jgi:hypothetical protein
MVAVDEALLGPDLEQPVAVRAARWNATIGAPGTVKVGSTTYQTEGRCVRASPCV